MELAAEASTPEWSPLQRVAFRFVMAYLILYIAPFPIDLITAVTGDTDWYTQLWYAFVPWFATHFLNLTITVFPNGSGDTTYNYVEVFMKLLLALLATGVWSALDHRRAYPRLLYWLRVLVRFNLGTAMLSYGFVKLVPGQFPTPVLDRLLLPLGEASPMGMLWRLMGTSAAYAAFGGMGEVIGGSLLVFRRTTTLGAIVIAGVMANVVALNFCFDVPVKLYSSHLLVMALFLLLPAVLPLANLLLLQKPAVMPAESMPVTSKPFRITLVTVKFLFLAAVLTGLFAEMHATLKERPDHPFLGIYDVTTFSRNGVAQPPLLTDSTQWRRVVVNEYGTVSVLTMDDRRLYSRAPVMETSATLTLGYSREDEPLAFSFLRLGPKGIRIEGEVDGAKIDVVARRRGKPEFPLLTRGFHWVNEGPLNR